MVIASSGVTSTSRNDPVRPGAAECVEVHHPAVLALYFASALVLCMCAFHPVLVGISLVSGLVLGICLRGWRAVGRGARWQLPFVVLVALVNPFFSASGSTELMHIGLHAIYLESLVYGACMGAMLVAAMLWCSNAAAVLTDDQVLGLLGNLMLAPFMAMTSDGVDTYELSPSEVLDRIWDYVWKPTVSGKKLSAAERRNQELFVSNLMTSGSFAMPGAKSSLAEEAAPAREDDSPMGIITYDAVSGFSWTPRVIINSTSLTQATLYAYLTKSYEAMKKRVGGASDADKAHYRLLMAQIDYSVR